MQNNPTMQPITKCLFPIAGYGTRFLPVTKAIPKEMLPILTKPLIQYGVEEAMDAGCTAIAMVTSKHKNAIKNYFDTHFDIETSVRGTPKEALLDGVNRLMDACAFSYIDQREMKGLGHAILTGEPLIGKDTFAVILPDDLCEGNGEAVLTQMMKVHERYPDHCIVAVEEIPLQDTSKYGIIAGDTVDADIVRVTDMVEKPDHADAPSNLAIIGRYILTPDVFDILRETRPGKGDEIQITDALLTLAKQGKVLAYRFKGRRFDCGSVDGFVEATNFFYSDTKALR